MKRFKRVLRNGTVAGLMACAALSAAVARPAKSDPVFPASDPNNIGGWVLNESVSDEFEGTQLDRSKWFIQGENGEYYIWKGRAPSQFAPHNVRLEDGKLKIRTQWEPEFAFANEDYADGANNDRYGEFEGKPLPITTAAVVGKKRFLYGYMETKSRVGDAAMTGAFWAIGYEQELDVFEQMGRPKIEGNITESVTLATAHDWSPPAVRPTRVFQHAQQLPWRTADEFHIYGAEWGPDYLNVYVDGVLVYRMTQDEVGLDWVLNNPMEIWFDSEIFKWLGVPHKEELPVDFEIEYVRVWQKPDPNLLDRAFFGFEGPILFEENPRPLKLVPESSEPNAYQQFWEIDAPSAKYLTIVEGDYATGVNSLRFSGYGKNESFEVDRAVITSPAGAVRLPAGEYLLSMKVWLEQGRIPEKVWVTLSEPDLEVAFDLAGLPRRQWVTVQKHISRSQASGAGARMTIELRKADLPPTKAAGIFIDDVAAVADR